MVLVCLATLDDHDVGVTCSLSPHCTSVFPKIASLVFYLLSHFQGSYLAGQDLDDSANKKPD
jgi:hypothetical protein